MAATKLVICIFIACIVVPCSPFAVNPVPRLPVSPSQGLIGKSRLSFSRDSLSCVSTVIRCSSISPTSGSSTTDIKRSERVEKKLATKSRPVFARNEPNAVAVNENEVFHSGAHHIFHFTFTNSHKDNLILGNVFARGPVALRHLYHESERLLVVFFFKKSCSVCHVYQPILERVIKEYKDTRSVHFVDLEVIENAELTKQSGISAVPVFHVYQHGVLLDEVRGVHCKRFLRKTFDTLISHHGSTPEIQQWAQERLESARKEGYYVSNAFRIANEAHHEHFQQFRLSRQEGAGGGVRGTTHLGHSAYLVAASRDTGDEHKRLRTFLPAFHVLPGVSPSALDTTRCDSDFCDLY